MRGNFLERTHIGLDYFDASINRVAAWSIGTRNMLKSLLEALLEPIDEAARSGGGRRLHDAAGAARGVQDAAGRRGLGLLLSVGAAFRCAKRGSTRCSATSIACSRPVHDRWL